MRKAAEYIVFTLTASVLCTALLLHTPATTTLRPEEPPQTAYARLLFAGDIMCHYPQINAAARLSEYRGFDFIPSFEYVKPYFDRADAVIANFETVVSPDNRFAGYPAFSSPKQLAEAMKQAGIDIAVTANNHCCDRGRGGIKATARTFDSLGILRTGSFPDEEDYSAHRIVRFELNGINFALMSYTYGTNGLPVPDGCRVNLIDTVAMARDLLDAADADCRIVFMHWGEEYQRRMNARQRRLKEFLQRHGAEIVIGSHPHVIQEVETDSNRIFAASLGNFVSNQRKRFSDGGLMAEIEVGKHFDGECRFSARFTPVWVALPDYRILPREVADTLPLSSADRIKYEQFISDTDSLLSNCRIL